jgi:hypothetical protein
MDSESDSDYIERLIDERKQLRVEIDDLLGLNPRSLSNSIRFARPSIR